MFDPLIYLGGSVKAIDRTDDSIKVGGYLVMFGTPRDGDLSKARDYFTPATDFGLDVTRKGIIRWAHCLDPQIGKRRLGIAEVKSEPDDVGLWAEGWMKIRDEYERKVADWIEARKVGWSSAALPHTVERKAATAGANEVVSWPLGGGDFTLTLAPADPRQIGSVMEMKAWLDDGAAPASFAESLRRLASDAEALCPIAERALAARKAEGRNLSPEKVAALKQAHDNFGRLLSECRKPADLDALEHKRRLLAELGEMFAKVKS
jgi:hypothetical protein